MGDDVGASSVPARGRRQVYPSLTASISQIANSKTEGHASPSAVSPFPPIRATRERGCGPRDSRGATKTRRIPSTRGRTGGCPLEQRGPLPRVRCPLRGPLELGSGLIGAAQVVDQVAAHAGPQVVACG